MGNILGNPEDLQALASRMAGQHTDNLNTWIEGQKSDVAASESYYQSPEADQLRQEHAEFAAQTQSRNAEIIEKLRAHAQLKAQQFTEVGQV
jgi:hypothetical protein